MFTITLNGIIRVNRGDSFSFDLPINIGTNIFPEIYTLTDNDFVYVGVMEANQSFENAIIRKKYSSKQQNDDGNIAVTFTADDTVNVLPGKYYYQVKLVRSANSDNPIVTTIVNQTQFFILQ